MTKKIFNNLEEIIGSVLLVGMCIVAVLQVASRYLLREPFSWTEELCTFMFVWLVFVGASMALRKQEHFAVEIIVESLPEKITFIVKNLSCLLVIIFALLLIWFGIRLAVTGAGSVTPALEIPRTIPYASIPVGGLLLLIRAIELQLKLFKKNKT